MIDPANPDYDNTPVSDQRPRFGYLPADAAATPHVTIITPFFNTGSVFHETARSVLAQSFQQWEWVIVDDGSTDPESRSVLDCYREGDPRIRIVEHGVNQGLSAARNTGFRAARAGYVVQIDSDDLLEPTAVEKWLWFLESYPEFGFVKGYSVGFGAQQYIWNRGFHDGEAFLTENAVAATSMIRRTVHEAVGGYDESSRDGLEDWDFWLRCANHGQWGHTVPEFLDWYRRRPAHFDRWANLAPDGLQSFREQVHQRYPRLWAGKFPQIRPRPHLSNEAMPDVLPCENRLRKEKHRLLMIVPWLTMGGADKFNLDLVRELAGRGWEITVATTLKSDNPWLPQFAQYTPDIFMLPHFLRLVDYPRFLRYLIASRRADVVLISNSELSYLLLPYLRAHFPDVTFVDFCHMEDGQWKYGGYPRMAVEHQDLLDLNVVSSEHLKEWMVRQGADPHRVEVCYTNIDPGEWRPDGERRTQVRSELGLDDEAPLIMYAGRICAQKQPRVFAETMLRLCRRHQRVSAIVAGDGPDLDWLRGFVDQHGLNPWVRLLGSVTNDEMKRLAAAADVFFLPSQWEGIALSVFEAMASGLPVVGADVGGQRELVTPECGVLIQRGDEEYEAERYAAVLGDLLDNPEWRRTMGRAGRARVGERFRLAQMTDKMLSHLDEAMRLHVTAPRPLSPLGLARLWAAQAVEYSRLSEVAEGLWQERATWQKIAEHHEAVIGAQSSGLSGASDNGNGHLIDLYNARWRTLVYFTITRFPLPYYWDVFKGRMKSVLS